MVDFWYLLFDFLIDLSTMLGPFFCYLWLVGELEICFPFLLIVGDDHDGYHDDNTDDATDSEVRGHCHDDDEDYR